MCTVRKEPERDSNVDPGIGGNATKNTLYKEGKSL